MNGRLFEIFKDDKLVAKIKKRLPYFFQLAELDASRAGKLGPEIGNVRERILVALLMYKFGEKNIETIPSTKTELDCRLFNRPISIKTKSDSLVGVKLFWTVDTQSAIRSAERYNPGCDMLFAHIVWNGTGGLYYIPLEVQVEVFRKVGRENYIKLPKPNTNPRGVEITKDALLLLINDRNTKKIQVKWDRIESNTSPYKRWLDLWMEEL